MSELLGAVLRVVAAQLTVVSVLLLGFGLFTTARGGTWKQMLRGAREGVRKNATLAGVWAISFWMLLRIGGYHASYGRYVLIAVATLALGLPPVILIVWLTMRRFRGAAWQKTGDMPKDAKRYTTTLTVVVCVALGILLYALGLRRD